jgi:ubiquinone/menaquinone biosynthesis C-methylase UbiE
MEYQLEQIREQQRASWNKFSPGWKKWDRLFMDFFYPMGSEIINLLNPAENDLVLDVASGTGEPGLTIAASLESGKVVITDLSERMLEIAKENAMLRGIKNIETVACDAGDLPFVDEQFNSVSCRLGFMFFPDMQLAANEMARVLKPGGRIATSVWNVPEKNFWITAMMGTIQKNMELPAPAPGSPGMFRCKEDLMIGIFKNAGFKNISVSEVTGKLKCQTAETYWNVMTELAAPVVAALDKADELTRAKIKKEVLELVRHRYEEGKVEIESSALIIHAKK